MRVWEWEGGDVDGPSTQGLGTTAKEPTGKQVVAKGGVWGAFGDTRTSSWTMGGAQPE
jgi:hypothetical protein